jgi:predicted nucleic acid-binding protein
MSCSTRTTRVHRPTSVAGIGSLSGEDACGIVSQWLAQPQVVVLSPGEHFWSIFVEQVKRAQVLGPLVTDAALAALAIESGATLCSTDRDFLRFEGLELIDPTR